MTPSTARPCRRRIPACRATGIAYDPLMDAVSLRDLYDHHAWSMDRLLARAAEVPREQAAKPWGRSRRPDRHPRPHPLGRACLAHALSGQESSRLARRRDRRRRAASVGRAPGGGARVPRGSGTGRSPALPPPPPTAGRWGGATPTTAGRWARPSRTCSCTAPSTRPRRPSS